MFFAGRWRIHRPSQWFRARRGDVLEFFECARGQTDAGPFSRVRRKPATSLPLASERLQKDGGVPHTGGEIEGKGRSG